MGGKMAYDGGYMAAAVRDYVLVTGRERPASQWISSPVDTWHKNPFYGGPDQPHPEDDDWRYEEDEE